MQKRRRRGVAFASGRSLSFNESDSTNMNNDSEESNSQGKNLTQSVDRSFVKNERRRSVASLTLSRTRIRKSSFQMGRFTTGRIPEIMQPQDIESHFTVILGSPAVGKTALVVRYVTGRFVHEYDPTLEMVYEKIQEVGHIKGILQIMDTAGSFESCSGYMKKAEGIIVVYSITDRYSFETAKDYLRTINEYNRIASPFDYELPTILVGNKRELRRGRKVPRDEARQAAKEFGCLFVESSAACDRNVQKIFINLFLQIHRMKEERHKTIANNARSFVTSVRNFFQTKKK